MEEYRVSIEELQEMIQEWGIEGRIQEKIDIWGIRYSQRKIHSLPYTFLRKAFLYHILRFHPQLVQGYEQEMLVETNLALKNSYSLTYFDYFKAKNNFDFVTVVISKVLKYFLLSHFPGYKFGKNIEGTIYTGIIEAILGYTIDVSTYQVLLQKMSKNNERKKYDSFRFDRLVKTQGKQELKSFGTDLCSEKYFHRNGQFDPFRHSKIFNPVSSFKMELKQILKVKKTAHSRNPTQQQPIQHQESDWRKNNYTTLNLKQLSAAMAIQEGFNKNSTRGSQSIHLHHKRSIKKKIVPEMRKKDEGSSQLIKQIVKGVTKKKSWNQLVESMRSGNKENKYKTANNTPYHFPQYLQQRMQNDDIALQKHKSTKKMSNQSINFKVKDPNLSMQVEMLPLEEEPVKKSTNYKRSNYMEQLNSFQKKCQARREYLNQTTNTVFSLYD